MGYPFDRENKKVANLDEFIGRNKNMKTVQVKLKVFIRFINSKCFPGLNFQLVLDLFLGQDRS